MMNELLVSSIASPQFVNLISRADFVAQTVLAVLMGLSVLSWAIILSKWHHFRRARVQSGRFRKAFRTARRLQDIASLSEEFQPSPLVAVFDSAFEELDSQGGQVCDLAAIQRSIQIGASEELTRLERRLSLLATTSSLSPFIGLFGTVWGIIDAFEGLGTAGAATLRAVAPGISEALITTAAGLLTAIPAGFFYNQLSQSVREFGARMDDFGLEFMNSVSRPLRCNQSG